MASIGQKRKLLAALTIVQWDFKELNSHPKGHLAWKLHSGALVILVILSAIRGGTGLLNVIGSLVALALTAPLLGFAWQRRVVPAWVGKILLVSNAICIPTMLFTTFKASSSAEVAGAIIALLLSIPLTYAAYVYSYRSEHLHRPPTDPGPA